MKRVSAEELKIILEKHGKWLRGEGGGEQADLSGVDLTRACLSWADLTGARMAGARMAWADLSGAKLTGARMAEARMAGADLSGAKLGACEKKRQRVHLC